MTGPGRPDFRLLVLGAAPRLAIAALATAVIWLLFLWSTSPVGAS